MRRLAFIFMLCVLPSLSCDTSPKERDRDALAFMAVKAAIEPGNTLGITEHNILTKANPKGAGEFVYASANLVSRDGGRFRPAFWVYVGGVAYAGNAPAKLVTPTLKWPREAPPEMWRQTNLDPFSSTDALAILYPGGY